MTGDVAARCPVRRGFTMLEPDFVSDPYRFRSGMQEQPVFYAADLDAYVVTRFEDVDRILPDTENYSNRKSTAPLVPPCDAAMRVLAAADYVMPPNLINADPPRHTLVRGYVAKAMKPRRLRALEPVVRTWAHRQIETMLDTGRADVHADLAFPLPALTGFALIGFPPEDLELLKSWCDGRIELGHGMPSEERQVQAAESVAAFWHYVNNFVAQRIAEPVDDFTSDLVRDHLDNPGEYSPRDIATTLFGIALASHETATNSILNGLRRLLENRGEWERLVEDRSRINNAIEEILRHDPSVISWRRTTVTDVTISDVEIPAGSTLILHFGCANRDAEQFPDPDVFDVERSNARKHLTFGKGAHFCLGAPLARMEMRVVLELLVEMAPGIRIAPDQEFDFVPNIALRGPKHLWVDLAAAA